MKNFIIAAFLFIANCSFVIAQDNVPKDKNNYLEAELTVNDFDIINATIIVDPLNEKIKILSRDYFRINLTNTSPDKSPLQIKMQFKATVTLEENNREYIFNAFTNGFLVPPGGREITTADANTPNREIDFTMDLKTKADEDKFNSDKQFFKDKVSSAQSGGKVPSGTYKVEIGITVLKSGTQNVSDRQLKLVRSISVTNPTSTVLDVPFTDGYVYPTPFPQFQWTYDTRAVMLTVYELRPEHQSLQDAIGASDPFLQVRIDRRLSGNLSSFTYPQSASSRPGVEYLRGPRQLERGKLYVIVLDGLRTAFGFDVDPLRTIRSFAIADPQGQVVINILQTTFGGSEFQNVFNFIQDQNLQLNANGITLNGVALSPQDLQKLLVENKDKIISVRFED